MYKYWHLCLLTVVLPPLDHGEAMESQAFGCSPLSWQLAEAAAQESLCHSCSTAGSNTSFDYPASCTCMQQPSDIHMYAVRASAGSCAESASRFHSAGQLTWKSRQSYSRSKTSSHSSTSRGFPSLKILFEDIVVNNMSNIRNETSQYCVSTAFLWRCFAITWRGRLFLELSMDVSTSGSFYCVLKLLWCAHV